MDKTEDNSNLLIERNKEILQLKQELERERELKTQCFHLLERMTREKDALEHVYKLYVEEKLQLQKELEAVTRERDELRGA